MDTVISLAIVRSRLLDAKCDSRDYEILDDVRGLALQHAATSLYARILVWAISNALVDMDAEAYRSAAFEINLVHNISFRSDSWLPSDEDYFTKGEMSTYMEHAQMHRIKKLFALFAMGAV